MKQLLSPDVKIFLSLASGKLLGTGLSREVYECKFDNSIVIKYEPIGFRNVLEWELWNEIQHIDHLKAWFAPCIDISDCGKILLQRRVVHPLKERYPELIPEYCLDTKYSNYGFLYDQKWEQIVCCDYGSLSLTNGFGHKMKKVEWRD